MNQQSIDVKALNAAGMPVCDISSLESDPEAASAIIDNSTKTFAFAKPTYSQVASD